MVGVQHGSLSSPVMVGRELEAERVVRALSGLADGTAPYVVISGEAGIGKSRLIDDALARTGAAIRVVRTECLALGSRIPYLPFAELLRDLASQIPATTLTGIVGPSRAELTRFLPVLATVIGSAADDADGDLRRNGDDLDRLRMYEAFVRLAERTAADHPTVFVIEDVQWIDQASLELLSFLLHSLRPGSASSLIISVRPEEIEANEPVLTLLADLGRGGSAERIELGPLSADATRRLVAEITRGQAIAGLAERIHSLSDGNPLFAEELLASSYTGADGGALPPKLRDLLAARLAVVPDDVLAVLRVAAASGRTIDDQLLANASELGEAQVQRAVRTAVDDHILLRVADQERAAYRFRHEILRSLVASQLLPAEARRIHAAYARALAAEPPHRQNPTEIANHWDAAGETEQALAAHLIAGERASQTYAFSQAHEHFERAMVLWERVADPSVAASSLPALIDRAASTAARAGDFDRAIALTRQVMADRDAIEPETFERARSSLRWYLLESGDVERALSEAESVVDEAASVPDRWRANALGHLAALLLYDRRTAEASRRATQARDLAAAAGAAEEQILAEGVLGWCLLLEGDIEAGLAAIRRALEAATTTASGRLEGRYPVGPALAHMHLAAALELVGRCDEAQAVALAGVQIAATQGVARTFGSTLLAGAARAHYQLGRWMEADAVASRALEHGAIGSGRIALLAVRALVAVGQGRDEDAAEALADADALIDTTTPLDIRRWLVAAHAERAIWQGHAVDALARLAILADDPGARGFAAPSGPPAILDASIPLLLTLGARACADLALEERATGTGEAFSRVAGQQLEGSLDRVRRRKALAAAWAGDLAMTRAELDRAEGDASSRVRRWRAAAEALGDRPYRCAYAHWRLAEALLARRDGREMAAAEIEAALALAEPLVARPLLAELRGLARRARMAVTSKPDGLVVTPEKEERPFGLTSRELEVLVLLADGMSNQEIADELFISPKTASVHVSNIYGKLGVESRVAAATTAHALGLSRSPQDRDEGSRRR
jgi:DNA-binding CsgD family transcriptional regulator